MACKRSGVRIPLAPLSGGESRVGHRLDREWQTEVRERDLGVGLAPEMQRHGAQHLFVHRHLATTESTPIDADIGAAVVAAAAVVAWLNGDTNHRASAYAETVAAWVDANLGPPSAELVTRAREALSRVASDRSELAALWRESGDEAWRSELQRIDAALAG
jgi:Domain of unknown function (DUF4259)